MNGTRQFNQNVHVAGQVIGAIILRNIRTRFGGSYRAYLIAIMWPYLHLVIVVSAYTLLGHTAPLGTDSVTYFAIALIPFILYMYTMRGISFSILKNRPLLYFPRVTIFDMLTASAILESLTGCAVCFVVVLSLILIGREFNPFDLSLVMVGFGGGLYFGIAVGIAWALVCGLWQGAAYLTNLWIISLYLASGIVFLPDALPHAARYWLSYNPLLQAVELARAGYYPDFHSTVLDGGYLFWFSTILICVSLAAEAVARKFMPHH